jgi:Ring finger domain
VSGAGTCTRFGRFYSEKKGSFWHQQRISSFHRTRVLATMKLIRVILLVLSSEVRGWETTNSSTTYEYGWVLENRTIVRDEDKTNFYSVTLAYPTLLKQHQHIVPLSSSKPVLRVMLPPRDADPTLCYPLSSDFPPSGLAVQPKPTGLVIQTNRSENCLFINVVSNVVHLNKFLPAAAMIQYLILKYDTTMISYDKSDPSIASILFENNISLLYVQSSSFNNIMDTITSYSKKTSTFFSSKSPYLLGDDSRNWNLLYQLDGENFTYERRFPNLYKFGAINLICLVCVAFGCLCCMYLRRLERQLLFGDDNESESPARNAEAAGKDSMTLLTRIEFDQLPILYYHGNLAELLKHESPPSILTWSKNLNLQPDDDDLDAPLILDTQDFANLAEPTTSTTVSAISCEDDASIRLKNCSFEESLEETRDDMESQLASVSPKGSREESLNSHQPDDHSLQDDAKANNQKDNLMWPIPLATSIAIKYIDPVNKQKESLSSPPMPPETSLQYNDDNEAYDEKDETYSDNPDACCAICLEDFADDELVIVLPTCKHFYHRCCVREWLLRKQGCCPLCKLDARYCNDSTAQNECIPNPTSHAWHRSLMMLQSPGWHRSNRT